MRERSPWNVQYYQRILATDPIALWMLDEKQGNIAYDLVSGRVTGAKNGAHVGVTLGEPGPGDGRTSTFYDGALDYTNVWSEELAGVEKVVNPGFETAGGGGADIWGTWVETAGDGALADELVLFHGGAHACKQTAGATANTQVAETFAVVAGTTFDLPIWTRGDGVNAGRYAVYDVTNGAYIVPPITTGIAAAAYAQVPTRVTAPPGCVSMRLDLMCPPANGGICYFDDVSLRGTNRFNGAEGTLLIHTKVANAGVWTDGSNRQAVGFAVAAPSNQIFLGKTSISRLFARYRANGTNNDRILDAAPSTTAWQSLGISWSATADEVRAYLQGVQVGATLTGLGVWGATALDATGARIGDLSIFGQRWFGNLQHCALWSKALEPAEIWDFRVPQ